MSLIIKSQLTRAFNTLISAMTPSAQQDEYGIVKSIKVDNAQIKDIAIRIFSDYAKGKKEDSHFKMLLDQVLKGVKPLAHFGEQLEQFAAELQAEKSMPALVVLNHNVNWQTAQ